MSQDTKRTIHNNAQPRRAPLKAELHAHTSDCRREPFIGYNAFGLIDAAAEKGFDILSITNHDTFTYTGYMRDYARERGIVLIPGVELTVKGKHILAYNLSPDSAASFSPGTLAGMKTPRTLYIAPHPFFPARHSLGSYFKRWQPLFDAIELCHFYTARLNFNTRAVRIAADTQLPLVGTSDCHSLLQLGKTYTLIDAEKDPDEVIRAVKLGAVKVVSAPLTLAEIIGISRVIFLNNNAKALGAACLRLLSFLRVCSAPDKAGTARKGLHAVPAQAEIRSRR